MSVKINYGPYEAHGVIRHREQRLHGALDRLNQLGIAVELVPSPFINVVTVHMRNKQIFRCDIRNLLFNMDYVDDCVAQRLVAAVEEAKVRFYSDQNVPQFSVIDDDSNMGGNLSIHYMYIIPHDSEVIKAQEEMIEKQETARKIREEFGEETLDANEDDETDSMHEENPLDTNEPEDL